MNLPAGVKDAKLNLSNAYRTTLTHLVAGDDVRMDPGLGRNRMVPAGTFAPKRSYWVSVIKVEKEGRVVAVTLGDGTVYSDFAHTSITRKERANEYKAKLEDAAAKRQAALDEAAARRAEYAAARKCGCDFGHLTEPQREACRARVAAGTPQIVLEYPAVVAENLVALAIQCGAEDPYETARTAINDSLTAELARADQREDYVNHYADQLIAVDALERKHDDERRALASSAAMRQRPASPLTHDAAIPSWSDTCMMMVTRPSGVTEPCGEPVNSPIHDPAAYLAYEKELKAALADFAKPTVEDVAAMTGDPVGWFNNLNKVTVECPRCPWSTTAVRYDESVEAILGAHLVRVHSKDMADEAEELKKLQLQAARYGMLVARLDGLRMDARAKLREARGSEVPLVRMNLMDEVAALVDEIAKTGR